MSKLKFRICRLEKMFGKDADMKDAIKSLRSRQDELIAEGFEFEYVPEELFDWVGHVHLEDIASSRIHNHLIPGRGTIDFLQVFKTMIRLGYRGDISLELYPYVDMPEEAGRESLEVIRPIFEEAGLEVGI